jgi:acid phosphatase type 7
MANPRGRRRLPAIAAFAVTATLVAAGLSMQGAVVSAATTATVNASADAYVDSANTGVNYGTATTLKIDGSPVVRTFLRFDLRAQSGTVSSAKLRIYAASPSGIGYQVARTGDAWTETGLTWASAPAVGTVVASSTTFAAATWTEVDVTSAVTAGTVVNFAIEARNGTAISLGSRESGYVPALVVSLTGAASSVAPAADTYADSTVAAGNYGTATTLKIDGSPVARAFLRFDLSGQTGSITSAKLRVYADSASGIGYQVSRTADTWTETGLTWASSPAVGTVVANSATFAAATWTEVDVTSAVSAGSVVNFAIDARNGTAITFESRESTHPPVLVVALGGGTITPPTASPTAQPTATPTVAASATANPTPTPAPTATASPTVGPTPTPAPSATSGSGDPQLISAGDVRSNTTGIMATTALVMARPGVPVLNVGDDSANGTAAEYQSYFNPAWGQFKSRIYPTPGNHEYNTSGAAPYFAYYGSAAGSSTKSWYSFDLANNWHVIELNGNISHSAGSPQEVWLKSDLAANAGKHIIAFWHQPRFSSGSEHGSDTGFTPFWNDLYAAHADIVFNGHDHDYERFALQNGAGQADPNGIREFVVGMGGTDEYGFGTVQANSQVRNNNTWGILVLTLHAHSYDWQFVPVAGKTFTDSGTQATHS